MRIQRIRASNFKSFKELDLEVGNFHVVVGPNAAGKSNFAHIFQFLKSVEENGLKDAVAIHGGGESIRNFKADPSQSIRIELEMRPSPDVGIDIQTTVKGERRNGKLQVERIRYGFAFGTSGRKNGVQITSDQIDQSIKVTGSETEGRLPGLEATPLVCAEIRIWRTENGLDYQVEPPDQEDRLGPWFPGISFLKEPRLARAPADALLLNSPFLAIPPLFFPGLLRNTAIYSFDPHLAKNPVSFTGRARLERDASNLALILDQLCQDKDKRRELYNCLTAMLPFIRAVDTEKFAENSVLMTVQEDFFADRMLRAHLLSDGTVCMTALIVALYFQEADVIILEEPERCVHPQLISRMIAMMKEAAQDKQILVTTHSPEVVKHAGLESLLLITRDEAGFSNVSRPAEKEELRIFLENEMGLDDLFVQNLLAI